MLTSNDLYITSVFGSGIPPASAQLTKFKRTKKRKIETEKKDTQPILIYLAPCPLVNTQTRPAVTRGNGSRGKERKKSILS